MNTEEELQFLKRIVFRSIEFCKIGIESKNMLSSFTEDKHKMEILRDKLEKCKSDS